MFRHALRAPRWTRHAGTVAFVGGTLFVVSSPALLKSVQNDASNDFHPSAREQEHALRSVISDKELLQKLPAYIWGTNVSSFSTIPPNAPRIPSTAPFSGRALRDLAIHETYGALVDASGDVYEWFPLSNEPPKCILKGKDIRSIAASSSNIYALSSSGRIYHLDDLTSGADASEHSGSLMSFLWPSREGNVLATSVGLSRREIFTSVSAGRHHLLAVTSRGRAFALPISLDANSHGQLGTRKVQVFNDAPAASAANTQPHSTIELTPKSQLDPFSNASPFTRASDQPEEQSKPHKVVPLLYEIPSLRGIPIAKAVAGDRSSYVLTKEGGRVLAWGANEYGQLGLGATVNIPAVSVPAEVNLSRSYAGNLSVRCTDIAAGGDVAYFTVESTGASGGTPSVDVYACGMGQYGALGNGTYVQAQGNPVKVKVLSGNIMFNEQTNKTEAIRPQTLSVSPAGHAFASLSSGRDLLAWGANGSYQLGNGKRASIAVPTYMREFSLAMGGVPDAGDIATDRQGRMTLRRGTIKELKDMNGRKVATNVTVQQWPVAGWNASALYWRIID